MFDFRIQPDTEEVHDRVRDFLFQSYDFVRRRGSGTVHKHERLLSIDPNIPFRVALPAALFYKPRRRYLYKARTGIRF